MHKVEKKYQKNQTMIQCWMMIQWWKIWLIELINFDERLNHEAACELFFHEVIFFLSLLSFNEKSNQNHNHFSRNNLETLNFNPEHFHTIVR